jgi:hypothetical protein
MEAIDEIKEPDDGPVGAEEFPEKQNEDAGGLTTAEAAVMDEEGDQGANGKDEDDKEKAEADGEGKEDGAVAEEEEEDSYDDREGMVVDGFRCPMHLLTKISPMEFEEMVHLFQTYDANGSGDIDKHEARKILLALDMDATLEKAEEFIRMVDADGSGEIDFNEFCEFIRLVKDGDERFKAFDDMMDAVSETPLGLLEKSANTQGFELKFQTVEVREATAANPPITVVELLMTGTWWERDEKGNAVGTYMTRKFQGLGVNHREAKYTAASAANVKLRQMMPGVQFKEGDFDDQWYEWIDTNLERGVNPMQIVKILADKGFHAYRNDALMQRIITWQSFDIFLARNGNDFTLENSTIIDHKFANWVEVCSRKGIDGSIIATIMDERGINLQGEHPLYYQKLKNNELGYMIDYNGLPTKYMSFWTCCEDGSAEDASLYLNARQPPNEETLSRTTGEYARPLAIAARNGHVSVINVLLEYGAKINTFDRRGRTALHHAALGGHKLAVNCLLDAGAKMFEGDFSGNTPLHLSSYQGNAAVASALAWRGQEFTRSVCADKVRPKSDATFLELSKQVFEAIMKLKLSKYDVRRVQKDWLHDAAVLFRSMCDEGPGSMVGHSCKEIMWDVLERFDPRPETGVYVSSGTAGAQVFVPTIPSHVELATLIKYVFRQAAVDSINGQKRTALHVACDQNRVDTHKAVVLSLIGDYGANTFLRDAHDRQAIDLLMIDRNFPGTPTATQAREEFIYVNRQSTLEELSAKFAAEEKVIHDKVRHAILDQCSEKTHTMGDELFDEVRECCALKWKLGMWECYEDPESLNLFYCVKPKAGDMENDHYTHFTWLIIPKQVKSKHEWTVALKYLRSIRCDKMREFGRWTHYRCKKTQLNFYYDEKRAEFRTQQPKESTWKVATLHAKIEDRLGYAKEWEVVRSESGNCFYRHSLTGECSWDLPRDAIIPQVHEKFCVQCTHKGKPVLQKYYCCEQCNRKWKTSIEGAKVNLKICEPCIFRCHEGHKGIRLVKENEFICLCEQVCRIANCKCNATSISKSQSNVQGEAFDERVEVSRKREQDALMPPCFVNVPTRWPDGTPKRLSGWQLCRRVALKGFSNVGAVANNDDDDLTSVTSIDSHSQISGSLNRDAAIPPDVVTNILESEDYPYVPPPGLPEGWIECVDPEEPEELRKRTRILVKQMDRLQYLYAIVVEPGARFGFYKVAYDKGYEEVVHRSRITTITRPTFFAHPEEGLAAWSVNDAGGHNGEDKIFHSSPLCITGDEWHEMEENSASSRTFFGEEPTEIFEEMTDSRSGITYFTSVTDADKDKAVRRIQSAARRYFRLPWKFVDWASYAFSLYPNEIILSGMRRRGAWAYMRRRSTMVGEFVDADHDEWEEYVDKESSEYFYWQEDANRYLWDKPPLPQTKRVIVEYIPIDEEVYFKFKGRREEEIGLVKRLRFDDESGEDMYDVQHKFQADMFETWVSRMRLKIVPKGFDELRMRRAEVQWRNTLRRAREGDDRKEKRAAEEQRLLDIQRLEDLRMGRILPSDVKISPGVMIAKNRQRRVEAERADVNKAIDDVEGAARREAVRQALEDAKDASPTTLSRADILTLSRTFEMKFMMEARIEKRNAVQDELIHRKEVAAGRKVLTENLLKAAESVMSSPRSLKRRDLCRQLHIGMRRQEDKWIVCEWGCGDWVRFGMDQLDHQVKRCTKRIIACSLGCIVKMSEEQWLKPKFEKDKNDLDEESLFMTKAQKSVADEDTGPTVQQYHEEEECVKRLVNCPRQCLEWVCFEVLEHHLEELCTKRPAKPIFCRLGCGAQFGGVVEKVIEAEDELRQHETEECEFRIVRCNWVFEDGNNCAAQMQAKDRDEHRDFHLMLMGVSTYPVAGTYIYRVSKGINRLKIQAWGGGGGSGYFKHRRGASGGGGAFVEVLLEVEPYDVLEIVVATGGGGGTTGTEIEAQDADKQREYMKEQRKRETFLSKEERIAMKADMETDAKEGECGITLGGTPGGGEGYGGGGYWACGGGGGYTIISKRTPKGNQALVVAAGGGGGGSVDGLHGGNMDGPLPGTRMDPVCGATASIQKGGAFGDSGSSFNSKWPAMSGEQWQGGNGSEFGGGGGGGYFGGGGGGTSPGIGGGGGGGSSYIYAPKVRSSTVMPGYGFKPGGLEHDPPAACGVGDWDMVGGLVGQGGQGDPVQTSPGNSGCVRIIKPGYY